MARTRVINIEANASQATKALEKIDSGTDKISNSAEQLQSKIKGVGQAADRAFSQLVEASGQGLRELQGMEGAMEDLNRRAEVTGQQIERSFHDAIESVQGLNRSMQNTFDELVERTGQGVRQVDSMEAAFADLGRRAELTGQDIRSGVVQAQEEVASSGMTMKSSIGASANNLGFELVQASQDAKFGMAGVANQIPLMTEQFTQLRTKTGSLTGAILALKSSLMGPVGIIAAVTLFLTFLPEIKNFFSTTEEEAEDTKDEINELTDSLQRFASAARDAAGEGGNRVLERLKEARETLQAATDPRLSVQLPARRALGGITRENAEEALKAVQTLIGQLQVDPREERFFKALTDFGVPFKVADALAELTTQTEDAGDAAGVAADQFKTFDERLQEVQSSPMFRLPPDERPTMEGGFADPAGVTRDINITKETIPQSALARIRVTQEQIDRLKASLRGAETRFKAVRATVSTLALSAMRSLTTQMGTAITQAESIGDAFENMGRTVVQALTGMIAKLTTAVALAGVLTILTGGSFTLGGATFTGFQSILGGVLGVSGGANVTGAKNAVNQSVNMSSIAGGATVPSAVRNASKQTVEVVPRVFPNGDFAFVSRQADSNRNRLGYT